LRTIARENQKGARSSDQEQGLAREIVGNPNPGGFELRGVFKLTAVGSPTRVGGTQWSAQRPE